ncbi:hypothetical protein Gotur_034495 [Gossypium turneri]
MSCDEKGGIMLLSASQLAKDVYYGNNIYSIDQSATKTRLEMLEFQDKSNQCHPKDAKRASREWVKENVTSRKLKPVSPDLCLQNKKLRDENARLREILKLSDGALLVEENGKLKLENQLLQVKIDALLGQIVDENRKSCGHK